MQILAPIALKSLDACRCPKPVAERGRVIALHRRPPQIIGVGAVDPDRHDVARPQRPAGRDMDHPVDLRRVAPGAAFGQWLESQPVTRITRHHRLRTGWTQPGRCRPWLRQSRPPARARRRPSRPPPTLPPNPLDELETLIESGQPSEAREGLDEAIAIEAEALTNRLVTVGSRLRHWARQPKQPATSGLPGS